MDILISFGYRMVLFPLFLPFFYFLRPFAIFRLFSFHILHVCLFFFLSVLGETPIGSPARQEPLTSYRNLELVHGMVITKRA